MYTLLFLAYFSFIQNDKNKPKQQNKSLSFSIHQNKEVTLINPISYLNDLNNQKNWYYVHFLTNNLVNIAQYISIDPKDIILKNTYLLFLSNEQLSLISDISLVKKLDPEDKIREDGGSFEDTKYLLVIGANDLVLEQNSRLYQIKLKKNSNSYLVKIDDKSKKKRKDAIRVLSEIPSVHSVLTYREPVLKNNLMTGFTQKNTHKAFLHEKSGIYYMERYLNERGLNGEGQIVTVVDTPIDFHHAMFNDDNATFELNQPLDHRKFVYYSFSGTVKSLEDTFSENEHGTHVAGTIAGESSCQSDDKGTSLFNGNAPKAKLIYFSFDFIQIDGETSIMNNFNSRISSNSWDYNGFSDSGNFEYTQGALNHPNIIFIFAAGNEYSDGNFTIDDPSGSRNILSVGAIDDLATDIRTSRFQSVDDESVYVDAEELYFINPFFTGTFGPDASANDIVTVNAEETSDCDVFKDSHTFLAYASSQEKASWVRKCVFYYSNGVYSTTDVEKVRLLINISKNSKVSVFDKTPVNETKPIGHSSFSSSGPANKGCIKPDIMAPGTRIFSAKSFKGSHEFHGCRENGTCDVTIMDGTSQATPNVAGAAALISQYFESGKWLKSTSVVIDSATMRALLINSCAHPQNSKTPDILYGHGVVDLSTLLPIENDFGLKITYPYDDQNRPFIGENGHKVTSLTVQKKNNKNKKLQVTLSYLDEVLNMHSPILLNHDIDLVVISPSGRIFKGDSIETGDSQHFSTNEKVIINEDEVEEGDYEIHIYSGTFIDSNLSSTPFQNFSIVATGDIENGYLTFADAQNCGCKRCDSGKPLHCKCEDVNIGPFCQGQIHSQKESKFTVTLQPHEIRRIRISPKNFFYGLGYVKSVNVSSIGDPGKSTFWIDKECHLLLGEFEKMVGSFDKNESMNVDVDFKAGSLCVALFNNNFKESSFTLSVERLNNLMFVYVAVFSLVGLIAIIVIFIVNAVKSRRNKQRNGFTEIKSLI